MLATIFWGPTQKFCRGKAEQGKATQIVSRPQNMQTLRPRSMALTPTILAHLFCRVIEA